MDDLRNPLLLDSERDEELPSQFHTKDATEAGRDVPVPSNDDDGDDENAVEHEQSADTTTIRRPLAFGNNNIFQGTLLPDNEITVRGHRLVEGAYVVKLIKFLLVTFGSIALVHTVAVAYFPDRDLRLQFWQIWLFEGDLIVQDAVVFFVVGRLWRQRGVDNLLWILMMGLSNAYFESQGYFSWMGHSVTLYEMQCVWPWQLWVFVACVVPLFASIVVAHIVFAYRRGEVWVKLIELGICLGAFVLPRITSQFFHFHHWFAGKVNAKEILFIRFVVLILTKQNMNTSYRLAIWNACQC
jgi:hypothetical protein